MTKSSAPIRVAIVGGGIAGATLANALSRIPHLALEVFEAAPEFSERGAAIGLSANYLAALNHIFANEEDDLLARAGAVPMNSSRLLLGSGPQASDVIFDLAEEGKSKIVHHASLLRELLAPLSPESLHANKQLTSINENNGEIELVFKDGSACTFDAAIGADGIFGFVRNHVLEDDAAECAASPGGFWDCRNLVSMERAKKVLGEQYFDVHRQYGWCGEGGFIMHDVLENGTVVQCVMSAVEKGISQDRKKVLSREFLESTFGGWLDGPIAKGMIDLSLDQDDPHCYSQWEHKKTTTYARGRVCIMGDAAHGTTPWQASGAGMAIEDAVILATLLGGIAGREEIEDALRAYDAVRRPRCQKIIESSNGSGRIMCGMEGLDPGRLREMLPPRWEFISSLNMDEHKEEALGRLKKFRGE